MASNRDPASWRVPRILAAALAAGGCPHCSCSAGRGAGGVWPRIPLGDADRGAPGEPGQPAEAENAPNQIRGANAIRALLDRSSTGLPGARVARTDESSSTCATDRAARGEAAARRAARHDRYTNMDVTRDAAAQGLRDDWKQTSSTPRKQGDDEAALLARRSPAGAAVSRRRGAHGPYQRKHLGTQPITRGGTAPQDPTSRPAEEQRTPSLPRFDLVKAGTRSHLERSAETPRS